MDILQFLNLQYWYCVIYSFFGGGCAFLNEGSEGGGGNGSASEGGAVSEQGVFDQIFSALSETFGFGGQAIWEIFSGVMSFVWGVYSAFAWGLSLFLFLAILFALFGLLYIRLRELARYGTLPPKTDEETVRGSRWQELLAEAMTTDPKRWRYAILEADTMLGELLNTLGYQGATTADKMRSLPEDAFVTVPVAWEAHRVRNFVSQGASDFILTQREAFRVMKLYEQVFEEFSFI